MKRYGFFGLINKAAERHQSPMRAYSEHFGRYLPSKEELERQKNTELLYAPLISIVVPAYETPKTYMQALIESVLSQSYGNWELCIADGSKTETVREAVSEYAKKDARIRCQKLSKNGGISENTNGGFAMAGGEYIALLDHDDLISANALYEMAACLNESYAEEERNLALIYSDEDKINGDGTVHSRPHFKPDYNPEFLRHNNYFCHFLMFSKELLKKTGGLKKEYDGAQDYDFVFRCADAGAIVRHVPKILYHWRIHEGSTAGNSADKSYAFDNGCRAIEDHLERNGIYGAAEVTEGLGVYKVTYALKGSCRITVAAEDKRQLFCIKNHYAEMSFEDKEYSFDIQYLHIDSFQNETAAECTGDYILYIQSGVKIKPQNLLETLLRSCQQDTAGAAGAKLLRKNRVLSCGFSYDKTGRLIPLCGGLKAGYKGYFLHAVIPQNVSVHSFGCIMLRKDAFLKIGGLDESLHGLCRDADYCFRLAEHGYGIITVPDAAADVYGDIFQAGDKESKKLFYEKWKEKLSRPDPCYNCNLSLKEGRTYSMKEF